MLILTEALRMCGAITSRAEKYATTLQSLFQSFGINGAEDHNRIQFTADVLHEILRQPFVQPQLPGTDEEGSLRPNERWDSSHGELGIMNFRDTEVQLNQCVADMAVDETNYEQTARGEGGGGMVYDSSEDIDSDDELIEKLLNRPDQLAEP